MIHNFPPGHYYTPETGFVRYFSPVWRTPDYVPDTPVDLTGLRETFERAVKKRLMTDTPYGVLVSGGLDSSLVASIASRYAKKRVEDGDKSDAWWSTLHSFRLVGCSPHSLSALC